MLENEIVGVKMVKGTKESNCQYISRTGLCTVLKVEITRCPEKCAFYYRRESDDTLFHSLRDDCRYLQQEGRYSICCLKGDTILSCAGCQKYDSIETYQEYFIPLNKHTD